MIKSDDKNSEVILEYWFIMIMIFSFIFLFFGSIYFIREILG